VISADTPLVAGAGIVGTVVGAALTRQAGAGIFKSLLGGGGGALIGVAATIGAGIFLHRHADDQTKPPAGQVAPSTTIHGTEHVKVMTYNLHGGMGGPGKMYTNSKELDALAATIKREQPDVVIVQESDSGALRSSFTDTLSELSSRLHPESAVEAAPAVYGYGRQQFSGVMTFNNFHVDNARELISADPAGSGIIAPHQGHDGGCAQGDQQHLPQRPEVWEDSVVYPARDHRYDRPHPGWKRYPRGWRTLQRAHQQI